MLTSGKFSQIEKMAVRLLFGFGWSGQISIRLSCRMLSSKMPRIPAVTIKQSFEKEFEKLTGQ
jgi:hypothetical protein